MKLDMRKWRTDLIASADVKAMPVMTYPGLALINDKSVADMLTDAETQLSCIQALANRYPAAAALTAMDLSVEAEAFGCEVRFSETEIPSIVGKLIADFDAAAALQTPQVGTKRTGNCLKVLEKATSKIQDRPVLGGCIGPFSLAGRLLELNSILVTVRRDPVLVHLVLQKCTTFLIRYLQMFKSIGANGVLIAEPAAGLLSPAFCRQFSAQYVTRIVDAVQDDHFIVILHNCGNTVKQIETLVSTGANGLHLGSTVNLVEIAPRVPTDALLFGNLEPAGVFLLGSPADVQVRTKALLREMQPYPNFVLSSGCDIPPGTSIENIDALFLAVAAHNKERGAWATTEVPKMDDGLAAFTESKA